MIFHKKVFFLLLLTISFCFALESCYSLKGISINPETDTYYVETFQNRTNNAPAEIAQQFSEALKDKINRQTRLNYSEEEPDIEFSGSVSEFTVNQQAPQRGETNSFNRLTIKVNVSFINNEDEKENWEQSFSFFQDFDEGADVTSVQDDLIENIYEQLVEDVFNRAFTNW